MKKFYPIFVVALCLSACAQTPQNTRAPHNPTAVSNAIAAGDTHKPTVSADAVDDAPVVEPVALSKDLSACFRPAAKFDETLVASSIAAVNVGGRTVWVAQTQTDDIVLFGESVEKRVIASNAQIACVEDGDSMFRIAWISRNAADGSFKLEVHAFDAQYAENRDEYWQAATRGFVPDAGSRCAFLGRREIIVAGTRPRGEHVPMHGLFRLQSRALIPIEGTSDHVPQIEAVDRTDGMAHLLLRTVVRDEQNKPQWPFGVYRLADDGEVSRLEKEIEADFVVRDRNAWLTFDRNGCYHAGENRVCPQNPVSVREIRALPDLCGEDVCVEMVTANENVLTRIHGDAMQTAALPGQMRVIQKENGGSRWLVATMDDARPDLANGVEWGDIDRECLGVSN